MGTDNLFHKRKAKPDKELKRRKAQREPYDYVLIVCEGKKTEPLYLRELIRDLRLHTANVEVCGEECGSSPKSVLNFALQKQKDVKKFNDSFDRVYCVFDKDIHESYSGALASIQNLKEFEAIASVPCFEFWLLLHFTYTDKPFSESKGRSICGSVIHELKAYLPDYEKGQANIYAVTKPHIDGAIRSAKAILAASERNGTDNPTTRFHELVVYLRSLKT